MRTVSAHAEGKLWCQLKAAPPTACTLSPPAIESLFDAARILLSGAQCLCCIVPTLQLAPSAAALLHVTQEQSMTEVTIMHDVHASKGDSPHGLQLSAFDFSAATSSPWKAESSAFAVV